jgi:hypothetical protein
MSGKGVCGPLPRDSSLRHCRFHKFFDDWNRTKNVQSIHMMPL